MIFVFDCSNNHFSDIKICPHSTEMKNYLSENYPFKKNKQTFQVLVR
jgi:hypothetical protein